MKKLIRILALTVCTMMLFTGCSLVEKNSAKDAAQIVAVVGTETIYKSDFNDALSSTLSNYGMTIDDLNSDAYASVADTFREQILEMLVDSKVELIKARELGLDKLTEEDDAEVQKMIDSLIAEWEAYYSSEVEAEGVELTETEIQQEIDVRVKNMREENGYTDDYLYSVYSEQYINDKLMDYVCGDIEATEEQLQATFDDQVTQARQEYEENDYYFDYDLLLGTTLYYYPQETRLVKHILLRFDDETTQAISDARSSEEEDADAMADALREEAAAARQEDLDAILAKIGDGSDAELFDSVMHEMTEDPGVDTYPEGYLVDATTTMYLTEFRDAAMGIANVGNITTVITDSGVHVMRLEKMIPIGAADFEDCREEVTDITNEDLRADDFARQVAEWRESYSIKTYPKRLG